MKIYQTILPATGFQNKPKNNEPTDINNPFYHSLLWLCFWTAETKTKRKHQSFPSSRKDRAAILPRQNELVGQGLSGRQRTFRKWEAKYSRKQDIGA